MSTASLARSIAKHPFIDGLPEHMVEFLAGCTKNMRFATGEYLFREGQAADWLYLLREGTVELESYVPGKGAITIETLGPGEAIGATIVFPPYDWHLDARATEPVLAFAVDGKCLRGKLDADKDFAVAVLRKLLLDVHGRLARARLQQLDVYKAELQNEAE